MRSFGTAAGDGATFVEIRASFAKDIGALSMVPSENELVLSPNSLHTVVASFGSNQLEDLQGEFFLCFFFLYFLLLFFFYFFGVDRYLFRFT